MADCNFLFELAFWIGPVTYNREPKWKQMIKIGAQSLSAFQLILDDDDIFTETTHQKSQVLYSYVC